MHSPAKPSDPWAPSDPWTLSARVLSSPAKKHDEIAVNISYDFREAGADIKLVKETSVSCAVGSVVEPEPEP